MKKEMEGSGETRLETGISYVLIIGVLVSLILEVAGMVLYYRALHSVPVSHGSTAFVQGRDFFTFLWDLLSGGTGQTRALRLMTLGIAILILTPYVRALMSVVYFALTKNVKYTLITLFVLVILTISLIAH